MRSHQRNARGVAVLAATLLGLAACGESGSGTGDTETTADAKAGDRPFEGEVLTVLNWNSYGSDSDLAVEGFEELTGAEVEHVYHTGYEELAQTLRTGGIGKIDVAEINPSYVQQYYDEGFIDKIDESAIENLDLVADTFMEVDDLYIDGDLYSVPWVWGSTGLTYNTEHLDEEPTSWGILWDDEMEGEVALMDDPVEAVMLVALYIGEDPHDPDLDAVREAMVDLRDNVELFWGSTDDFTRAFTTEAISAGNYWAGDAGKLASSGEPVGYVIPEEGAPAWVSTWSVLADAPNPELAHAWIDWMISTEFLAGWVNDPDLGAPAPATVEAQEALTDEAVQRTQAFPDQVDRLAIMQELSQERQQQYTDLLAEVKAGS